MKCFCPPDPERNSPTIVDHLRLFPKRPGVCWEFRVHEQILPSLKRLGAEIRWTEIVIQHVGYLDLALRNRKRERDFRLLKLEEKDNPNHPYVLFNLAIAHEDMGNFEEALRYVRRSLERCERGVSIERKLYAISAGCQRKLGKLEEAIIACQAGQRVYPEDVELLFQEGLVRRLMGDLDGAAGCFQRAIISRDGAHFGSVAVGLH